MSKSSNFLAFRLFAIRHECKVADGLMRAGFAQESFWDWWSSE
ncbi:UNVERIFIED_ORG: hypothetical protein M2328_003523 [Rhodococcus erythropolis]